MAWGKVDLCGLDTSKLPVLTPQRMQELYPLVHSGDKAARDEFIQGNLRLVLSVIQRFSGRGENVDDLFQVGCIGLMKALDNFDVSQNVRFSTYAVPMVIGEIRRYLRDNNAIRGHAHRPHGRRAGAGSDSRPGKPIRAGLQRRQRRAVHR